MMINCQDNEIIMPVTQEDEQTLQQTDVRFKKVNYLYVNMRKWLIWR